MRAREGVNESTALFVRVPSEQARRLDRAAFELRVPKQQLISGLLERYVDPDCPRSLASLTANARANSSPSPTALRRGVTIGHHSFHASEQEVLTCEETAELLRVDAKTIERLAGQGTLPGRLLDGQWRFSRSALLRWLEGEDEQPPPQTGPHGQAR